MPTSSDSQVIGSRARVLRIGVLLDNKMVEERMVRERTSVSIGQSMKNTFSIPVDGLPLEYTMFAIEDDKYVLRFLGKMDGRLSDSGGQVSTLEQLKAKGAVKKDGHWEVKLGDSSRGKITLGELTVLFQFVSEPPRQPKPMLPASVRGTFADRFDPRLSIILAISIIAHFTIMIIAIYAVDPEDDNMAERAFNMVFRQDTFTADITPPPTETKAEAGSDAGSAAKPADKKADKPTKAPPKGNDGGGHDSKAPVQLRDDDVAAMVNGLTGSGPNGRSAADMANRSAQIDLGTARNEVLDSNRSVGVGGNSGRGSRDDGGSRPGTGTGPNLGGAPSGIESAGGGKTTEHSPQGRISITEKSSSDDSTLTPEMVLSKIMSAYMAGLKRCYKTFLNKDASARGRVTLSLTVNGTGRTTKGSASGFAPEVDACITAQMGSWHFPSPKDKDGEATEANFQITLQLVPD